MHIAIVLHMAGLAKHGELDMRIFRVMVEMGSSKPDSVEAMVNFAPALFALLGTTDFTLCWLMKRSFQSYG